MTRNAVPNLVASIDQPMGNNFVNRFSVPGALRVQTNDGQSTIDCTQDDVLEAIVGGDAGPPLQALGPPWSFAAPANIVWNGTAGNQFQVYGLVVNIVGGDGGGQLVNLSALTITKAFATGGSQTEEYKVTQVNSDGVDANPQGLIIFSSPRPNGTRELRPATVRNNVEYSAGLFLPNLGLGIQVAGQLINSTIEFYPITAGRRNLDVLAAYLAAYGNSTKARVGRAGSLNDGPPTPRKGGKVGDFFERWRR